MTNKATNWVTIPEEKVHTPVSKKPKINKKPSETETVKHKLFWGVSFVILVVVTFGLLAPQEFTRLIQGNLFETSDLPASQTEQDVDSLGILPEGEEESSDQQADEQPTQEQQEATQVAQTTETGDQETTVVQPETQPTSIQVEPVSEPEEVDVQPVDNQQEQSDTEPQESEEGQQPEEDQQPTEDTTQEVVADDPNQALLDQLTQQVNQLQEQQSGQSQVVEDLISDLQNELRPSAPEQADTGQQTPPTPKPVTTTTAIGQQPTATMGYRENPHKVAVQPAAVLQQNQQIVAQSQEQGQTAQQQSTQQYQAQLQRVQSTPESGPAETLMIAMILSMLGFTTYKVASGAKA